MAVFSEADLDRLAAPHVARAWFLAADLPTGMARFHNGVGRVVAGGYEWRGVTDPVGGQLVSLSNIEEPRFGQAVAVQVTLSGANLAFFRSMHDNARDIEGRSADVYWAAFDGETAEVLIEPKRLFRGQFSAPALSWGGIGIRTVSLTIESIWSAQNFPFGGRWNGADQRKRYAGDLGLDFVGVDVAEVWK